MVVIHHYGGGIYPFSLSKGIFGSGNLAVSYFFVLSGFVLYLAHEHGPIEYWGYLKRRIARIFPLYYFAMLLTILVVWLDGPLPANITQQILYSALMIQAYIPSYALTLNLPAWSISVELFFYLIFPFLLRLEKKHFLLFASVGTIIFVMSQILHLSYYEQRHQLPDNIVDPLFFSPAIHISQFMVGMAGGWVYKQMQNRPMIIWYVPVMFFVATVLVIAFRPDNISYHVGLIAPLFALLIISVARSKATVLNLPGFVFLGEISYGIYILQYPVFRSLQLIDQRFLLLSPGMFFFASLIILLITSAVLHYVIERPVQKLVNRAGKHKTTIRS